jgi:hypothetical protein
MKARFNWPTWAGLLLCVVAFISYFAVFTRWPVTRDVPWASFALFAIALFLLAWGWRRAPRKIVVSIVAVLGLLMTGMFTYLITGTKGLPVSANAPREGQKAPQFAMADTQGRTTSLSQLLAGSNGVLLVFYRGHW